jgi:hypothetical protein
VTRGKAPIWRRRGSGYTIPAPFCRRQRLRSSPTPRHPPWCWSGPHSRCGPPAHPSSQSSSKSTVAICGRSAGGQRHLTAPRPNSVIESLSLVRLLLDAEVVGETISELLDNGAIAILPYQDRPNGGWRGVGAEEPSRSEDFCGRRVSTTGR